MRKWLLILLLAALVVPRLLAEAPYILLSDKLNYADKNKQSMELLLGKLPGVTKPAERAEIYWRLSRDVLRAADDSKVAGASAATLLEKYLQGESYAQKAIELDPKNPESYYWKASNIGRWGQTRGILASLYQAGPMRRLLQEAIRLNPNLGDPWFVLGQLYEQVPGFPISFGNVVYAVSLGRKAIEVRKAEVAAGKLPSVPSDYYIQLARHLAKRNWSAQQREREHTVEAAQYAQATGVLEKGDFYEGEVQIPPISDRQEAIELVTKVASQLEATPNRTVREDRHLKEALGYLNAWSR